VSGVTLKCTGSDYINDVVVNNPTLIFHDLGVASPIECGLRNVSWVIPNGTWSDHPGFDTKNENDSHQTEGGPAWVANIINSVGTSPCKNPDGSSYWNTTAIFVVWDDWGGFYDHVAPFNVVNDGKSWGSGYVYGFRVPFLVVSAYTGTLKNGVYSGYVSGTPSQGGETFPYVHDFGSILGFTENNFLGSGQIGQINPGYQFADAFAPDYKVRPLNIPLADFFPLTSARPFQAIALPPGAPDASYFINYNGPIEDPDNDVIDND
jgi:hypothetical protein